MSPSNESRTELAGASTEGIASQSITNTFGSIQHIVETGIAALQIVAYEQFRQPVEHAMQVKPDR